MKELIEDFAQQISKALEVGAAFSFTTTKKKFANVVICGLGGSGIGASFVKDGLTSSLTIPLEVVKGYSIPQFVDENTLLIVASYSGNTEEAISCLEEALKKNATIVGVSSNGKLKELCAVNSFDCVLIPSGFPPRSAFAYSTVQLYYILHYFGLTDTSFIKEWKSASALLSAEKSAIKNEAKQLAENVFEKIPVLYSANSIESVTIRWRQQINENGKQLCWHHVVPEMNHNELVGWRQENANLAVIFLRNKNDLAKIAKRMELNRDVYKKYTPHIFEVWSKGNSFIERAIYLINLGDWLSYYLSELRGFDTSEVKVIDELKANLN